MENAKTHARSLTRALVAVAATLIAALALAACGNDPSSSEASKAPAGQSAPPAEQKESAPSSSSQGGYGY